MGTLRFIFAITILLGHIYSIFGFRYHELLTSPIAFESFFLLSGFYMTMVWSYDYSRVDAGFKKFLLKRVFRIFPLYWLILFITIIISLTTYVTLNNPLLLQTVFSYWNKLNWPVKLYIIFSNLFIFGQEGIYFLKINYATGAFEWSHKFIDGDPPLHFFLLISQAWAISYILYFYLLVPLINKCSSLTIFAIVLLLLAARFTWYYMGHQNEPWLYRFFPFEFVFFLAGMLSFRAYDRWKEKLKQAKHIGIIVFVAFFLMTCLYDLWQHDYLEKEWLYYGMLCALMPLFFTLTKSSKADNYLGQLAYPAYISNFIIIHIIMLTGISNHAALIVLVLGTTVAASVFLLQYVSGPLNKFALEQIVNRGNPK